MSRIRRGTPRLRRHAKNYIYEQAQARLQETIKPFNEQVINSLYVDSVEIDYYQMCSRIGRPCTCEKIAMQPEHNTFADARRGGERVEPVVPRPDDDMGAELGIRMQDDNLFGDSAGEKLYGENTFDVSGSDYDSDDDIPEELMRDINADEGDAAFSETTMFGSNANCGVCYKTGFQPGYVAYGRKRYVLTNWDIIEVSGYTLATHEAPNKMVRQGPEASHTFVEFEIHVPKYFKHLYFSIRNNTEITTEKFYVDGELATLARVKAYAGKYMRLRVSTSTFTHVVLEFDQGMHKVRANIGLESQALTYSRLEALSNFPMSLPPNIHEVNTGDIVVIKDRRLVLKIMDKERKITADKQQLEWVVQTRLVQRTEPLRDISKGLKLL